MQLEFGQINKIVKFLDKLRHYYNNVFACTCKGGIKWEKDIFFTSRPSAPASLLMKLTNYLFSRSSHVFSRRCGSREISSSLGFNLLSNFLSNILSKFLSNITGSIAVCILVLDLVSRFVVQYCVQITCWPSLQGFVHSDCHPRVLLPRFVLLATLLADEVQQLILRDHLGPEQGSLLPPPWISTIWIAISNPIW